MGVVVWAALQDPRKEVVKQRDLFPVRIALRLIEREAIDMVLGPGARDRGAECDRIDPSTPGVGFMWCDGQAEPTRFRAAYVTDDDIAAMARAATGPARTGGSASRLALPSHHPRHVRAPPRQPPAGRRPGRRSPDVPVPGGVVIDLADMVGRAS